MAARVTAAEVKEIIDVDASITDDYITDSFIAVATEMVDSVCISSILSDALLKRIEQWLAAHFIAVRDVRSAEEEHAGVYQYKVDLGLDVTMYGQQAKLLDISGALAALDKQSDTGQQVRAKIQAFGR